MSKAGGSKTGAQPSVVMESEVARKIRQHARTSMKAEVCGILIGSSEQERVKIEACIAGVNAAQGGAHVTFTQDTWEHIYKIKDERFPDEKIVGWYHSHPGFGVFLSEHDMFIQENFFSSPQQVAWVFDPHTDEEGCFGWVNGKVEKLPGVRFGYSKPVELAPGEKRDDLDDEEDAGIVRVAPQGRAESSEPAWVVWTSRALMYGSVMLLGFVGGYMFFGWRTAPAMDMCQQIIEHPLQACSAILQQYQSQYPGLPPAAGNDVLTPKQPAGPAPAAPAAAPGPQQKPPADKANHGKH